MNIVERTVERDAIFEEIHDERERQDATWGEAVNRQLPLTIWLTVLVEEVGEVAQDILKHRRDNLRIELIQTAAVAVAMLECLDDASWGVNESDAG